MRKVAISILGARLDYQGLGKRRWNRWRPSLSILMHDNFVIDKFVLIHHKKEAELAAIVVADMKVLQPTLEVITHIVDYEDPWDFEQVYSQLHDFTRKYLFEPESEEYYVHITTGTHVVQICLYLLTEANYLPGKLLQTAPSEQRARGKYQIIDLDLSRYDQIASRFAKESAEGVAYLKSGIETPNQAFNQLMEQLEKVSIRSTAPILLMGATGAGKSRLAKRIYQLKKHRSSLTGRLVEVNCATLRGDNAMSALFGHVKGAFTGAVSARAGLLREAHQGLLFLDEISELGLDEQAMLLRAIEDKCFMPFGADHEVSSDFQLIAGTNRDLFLAVREGKFREDLLARINLWTYRLPSLKERIEDFEPNLEHELANITEKMGYKVSFNKAAREKYLQFALSSEGVWQANFRDLNSSIIRLATLAQGGRITEAMVSEELKRLQNDWRWAQQGDRDSMLDSVLEKVLSTAQLEQIDAFDRVQLAYVIQVCRKARNMAEAGRQLFQNSRTQKASHNDSHRVRVYLQKFDLHFEQLKGY